MGTTLIGIKIGGGVMKFVYKLEHKRLVEVEDKTREKIHDTKSLGFFKSEEECNEIISLYLDQPGFKDYPDSFFVEKIEADINDFNDISGEFGSSFFQLWHEWYDGEYDHISNLGYYSTKELAEKALINYQLDPEFIDHPDSFDICECEIGLRGWTEGFFTY